MTSWKVCDKVPTEQLEGKLNALAQDDFEIHRLEWVIEQDSISKIVPLVTRIEKESMYSATVTDRTVKGSVTHSGYWIIIGCKIDNE